MAAPLSSLLTLGANPRFSWDTLPLYWYSTNASGPFSKEVAEYAASFPVVCPNGNHERFLDPVEAGEQAKLLQAAKQLKAINTNVSVLYYMNSMMDWTQYGLHNWLHANHPEWWVKNKEGETVCLDDQPLFNLSIPEMRQKWLDSITSELALGSGVYDGLFADRANALPKGGGRQPGPGQSGAVGVYDVATQKCSKGDLHYEQADYDEWAAGHAIMLQAAQKAAGDGIYVVANNNATQGVGGRQFERWCNKDFDGNTIIGDIAELKSELAAGKVALVHGGEPCDANALSLSLSAFLMGAERNAYFACTDGWSLAKGWMPEARWPEYDRKLGAPKGDASVTTKGHMQMFERSFASGTRAVLVVDQKTVGPGKAEGCVFWSDGNVTGNAKKCNDAKARVLASATVEEVEEREAQPAASYAVSVVSQSEMPVLDYVAGTSAWQFAYNPAYLPANPPDQPLEGLNVRVQSSPFASPGVCMRNSRNTSASSVAFAPIDSTTGKVGPLLRSNVVFSPAGSPFEATAEDPRVVLHRGTYFMTYTAHADASTPWPTSLRQGVATSTTPLDAGSWVRHCTTPDACALPPAYKSGAMLPRDAPPHYMFVYNLTNGHAPDPDRGATGAHGIVVATSVDLLAWKLTEKVLLPTRPGMWDQGLVEPGPPPERLTDGNYFMVYNSAAKTNDDQYHAGWAILDGHDPTVVLHRSSTPILSYSDLACERGNSTKFLCNVANVVFVTGMKRAKAGADEFVLFYGGADAVVGTALVRVERMG